MGFLLLAVLVAIGTVAWAIIIVLADSISDAPSVDGLSPVPTLVIGTIITCVLLLAWWLT